LPERPGGCFAQKGPDPCAKVSSFVQLNDDGHPDILLSHVEGGLTALLNDGRGNFTDVTGKLDLDDEACGVGGNGYFAPGDFNNDGQTDLYYATGKGLILLTTCYWDTSMVKSRLYLAMPRRCASQRNTRPTTQRSSSKHASCRFR